MKLINKETIQSKHRMRRASNEPLFYQNEESRVKVNEQISYIQEEKSSLESNSSNEEKNKRSVNLSIKIKEPTVQNELTV